MNKKFIALVMIAIFSLTSCAHPLEVKHRIGGDSLKYFVHRSAWKSDLSIGVKPFQGLDRYGEICYSSLVQELDNVGAFADVIKNFTGKATKTNKSPDLVLEVEIDPKYRVDRGKNFAIQWPGFIIFMPAWYGLVYTLLVDTTVTIRKHPSEDVVDVVTSQDNYRIKYTSPGRGVLTGFPIGWFFLGSISLLSNMHIEWSDTMRDEAYLKLAREYGIILSQKVVSALSLREKEFLRPEPSPLEPVKTRLAARKVSEERKVVRQPKKVSKRKAVRKALLEREVTAPKVALPPVEAKTAAPQESLIPKGPISVEEVQASSKT